jgi:hypothetical protein
VSHGISRLLEKHRRMKMPVFFLAWSAFVNCTDQLFRPVFAFRWFIMPNYIEMQLFCCCLEPAFYRFIRRSLLILFYSFSESVKERACAWRGIVSPIAYVSI